MKIFLIILGSVFGFAVLFVLWYTVSAYIINPNKEYDKNSRYYRFMLNLGTWLGIHGAGIRVHVTGKEKLPEGRFLFVSNHRSNFDPIVTWYAFKKENLAFLSKEKNFHVLWFGRIIRRCCFMCIDREDPRKAIRTIRRAAELMQKNEVSIGVYPEGTRSLDGTLLPFHNGVFMIAQKACAPIVVATVRGTEKVQYNYFRRKTDVYIDIVDVIPAEEAAREKTDAIGERVREDLEKAFADDNKNITITTERKVTS